MWYVKTDVIGKVILICLSFLKLADGKYVEIDKVIKNYTFPDNFVFGVSTAAFQIEGAWNEAVFSVMRNTAVINVRASAFKDLLMANIVPIITLYHWDLHTAFVKLGGWTNGRMVDYFEDYSRLVFQLFGDLIRNWITINEIHHNCYNSYGSDSNPPAISSPGIGVYLCFHYMLLAHARAYRLYEKHFRPYQKGAVGINIDANWVTPKNPDSIKDQDAADHYLQMHVGLIAHPIFSKFGDYPASVRNTVDNMSYFQGYSISRLPYFTTEEVSALRRSADFLGFSHFSTSLASYAATDEEWTVPSLDHDTGVKVEQNSTWPRPGVYPPGFRKVINWLTDNYGKEIPLIVMENRISDRGQHEDYDRVSYMNDYLYQLLLSIHEDGCNVRGYFACSLMENFEWNYGFIMKFGLYHVDFSSPNRTRMSKLSAENYANIVRTRHINFDFFKHRCNHSRSIN